MKRFCILLFFFIYFSLLISAKVDAQCSICAKTTQQMGDKPARGFNSGIIYLMITPFALIGFVGYKWWKNNKEF